MNSTPPTSNSAPQVRRRRARESFQDLFADISPHYQTLKVPAASELKLLDDASLCSQKHEDTTAYIVATVTATFFFLSFPILLTWGYEAAASMQIALLPYLDQSSYLNLHPGVVAGLVLSALAGFSYAFVMHTGLLTKLPKQFLRLLEPPTWNIARSEWRFGLYQALMMYFVLAVGITLVYSFFAEQRPYSAIALHIWLFLPVVVLGVFPTVLLFAVFVVFLSTRSKDEDAAFVALLREMLLLLRKLKNVSHSRELLFSQRRKAIERIERASSMFRLLYAEAEPGSELGMR